MSLGISNAFHDNKNEIMTPILPPDVNSPATPQVNGLQAAVATIVPMAEKRDLVDAATLAGSCLRDGPEGMKLSASTTQQSAFGEFGGQAAKLGAETGAAAFKIGGELIGGIFGVLNDENDKQPKFDDKPAFTPAPQFQMNTPAPGFGMGSGGGGLGG